MLEIIVAVGNYIVDKGYPIGKDNKLPWKNSNDLKWFRQNTEGNIVIMGRKTFESIGKPLPNRINIVISRQDKPSADSLIWMKSIEDAIRYCEDNFSNKKVFLIGGASLYQYAIEHHLVDKIHIDYLNEDVPDADAFFPNYREYDEWDEGMGTSEIERSKAYAVTFTKKKTPSKNTLDEKYLALVKDTMEHGYKKHTRAGDTRSVFGRQLRVNLKEGFPLLTTKKMFFRGMIHELLWFLKGDTNIKYLVDNNVHIWDDDAYRFYLELSQNRPVKKIYTKDEFIQNIKDGMLDWFVYPNEDGESPVYRNYTFGDLGPVYGKQWRDWNGIDQIQNVIDTLRNNPDDRRLLVVAWNVGALKSMALPPCHYSFQFYTRPLSLDERREIVRKKRGEDIGENIELLDEWNIPSRGLSCMFNMRSCDCGLGVPINIASYALLTHMIAQCDNMEPDELIFNGGDFHIYENHIEALTEQLNRDPKKYELPVLKLNPEKTEINDFTFDDIEIVGYESYPVIKMPLSVGL